MRRSNVRLQNSATPPASASPHIIDVPDVADARPAYRIYQGEASGAIYILDANGQAIGEI